MKRKKYGMKTVMCILCIILIFFNLASLIYNKIFNSKVVMATTTLGSGITRIADKSTVDSYKDIETNSLIGGRYNGRVWTDKSVYSHDQYPEVKLDEKFNISYDDDFLTVFSALGSSQLTKSPIAMDVSIMIDVSGSMGTDVVDNTSHDDSTIRIAHSRIQLTINAVNNAIDTLMEANENNRVCVVTYGGTAFTLMELGHYTKLEGSSTYITVKDFTTYNESSYSASGSCAYTLCANAKKDGDEINRTIRNNYANDVPVAKRNTIDACIGFHTNMQAGIYKGFDELYKNVEDDVIRFPSAIIMTDGGSNYALKNNSGGITGDEWHDVPIPDSLTGYDISSSSYQKYRAETNQVTRGGKEVILDIMMTASYMKVKVQKKYEKIFNASTLAEQGNTFDFQVHTVSVDTQSMFENTNAKWQVPRIYSTLDPKEYFKAELPGVTWEYKKDSTDAYALFEEWKTSPDGISTTFKDTGNNTINFKINKLNDETEVSNKEIIENIIYNDTFQDITAGNVDDCFKEIIVNATSFNPIGDSENDADAASALSYVDPIGKYMEVKDVKKLLLFGQSYNVIKDEEIKVEDIDGQKVSRQYYRAVSSDNNDLEIKNPSYTTETKFKLSEIKIWKEISNSYMTDEWTDADKNFDEALHITVPSNAIPIHLDTIELDGANRVKKYESNQNTDSALPIRVVYTIGISSKIINQTTQRVDLTKLSRQYFMDKKEEVDEGGQKKKYIDFYSNYYSGELYDEKIGETFGNAAITFTPSSTNRFYIFQKNLTIYTTSTGGDDKGEGELASTGGTVNLTGTVTDIESIDKDATYYFAIDYYIPGEQADGSKGRAVKYATSHKGEDFFGANGECYLSYYNTTQKKEVESKGANVVVTTKKGTKRVGDLKYLAGIKTENVTNTANTYYAPSYGHIEEDGNYSIITYFGNNGKLRLQTTELLITKTVENKDKDHYLKAINQDFNFTLTLDEEIDNNKVIIYKCKWNGSEWLPKAGKTYVITNNEGYILYEDGNTSPYWVGNEETQRLVGEDGKITVYKNSSKDGGQVIDVYKDRDKIESDYKLDVQMQTETLNFVKGPENKITTTFTLKDGEGVLLTDMGADTGYTVTEEDTDELGKGFEFVSVNEQTDTSTFSGTTAAGKTEKVEFINKYTETINDLQLSKTVIATKEQQNIDWTFKITFIPTKDVAIFDKYKYEGISIVNGVEAPADGEIQFEKNSDGTSTGTINLKHGQAIKIKDIAEEITYKITENGANENKYTTTFKINYEQESQNYIDGATGQMAEDQIVDFINAYQIVDFEFTKVANEDITNKLSGAKFQLYELICEDPNHTETDHDKIIDTNNVSTCWKKIGEVISGESYIGEEKLENGQVKFENIMIEKEYRLIEVTSPLNRTKPIGQWKIIFKADKVIPEIKVVGNAKKTPAFMENGSELLLPNMSIFQLPNLGGGGNIIYIFIALILIFLSYYRATLKRKRRKIRKCK